MAKHLDLSAIEPITEPIASLQTIPLPPSLEPAYETPSDSPATSREGGTNSQHPVWRPTEPQFTKAIAQYYGVSRKSVQQWFQKVREACPWFTDADLKLTDGRYSPICIDLMGSYRTSGLPFEAWKAQLWEQNPDLVAAYQSAQQQPLPADPPASAPIAIQPSTVPIPVQEIRPLNLTVIDSTQRLTEAIASLDNTLKQFVTNDQTLESALKQTATQKGTRLGTELAITEVGSMVQATDSVRLELAKKLGLITQSADPPEKRSA